MSKVITALLAVWALSGCEAQVQRKVRALEAHQATWDSCIERGGIPIVNDWLGYPVLAKCEGMCDESH